MSNLPVNLRTDLESRILRFQVDSGQPEFGFLDRLAQENGWTRQHAQQVYDEYLKFLYLCSISTDTLTPSDAVDQAWHLHLTYSASYWTDLCGNVLGRALHHGPTRGGRLEDRRYHDAYDRTLRLYQSVWGESPPETIWPAAADRFRDAAAFRRINTATHIVVSRQRMSSALLLVAVLAAIGYPAYAQARDDSIGVVTVFLTIVVAVLGLVLVSFLLQRRNKAANNHHQRRRSAQGSFTSGCAGASGKNSSDGGGDGGSGCGGGGGCGSA